MNLTDTAALVKKGLRVFLLVVVVYYIFILIVAPGTKLAVKRLFTKPIPPNTIYGLLDPLEFVEKPILGSQIQYVLNTKNGRLPNNIPETVPVYRFKTQPYSYLAGKNAVEDAAKLGFTEGDMTTDLKGNLYKWRNLKTGGTLEIMIETRELKLNVNLAGRSRDYIVGSIYQDKAKETAKSVLENIGRFNDGLYPSGRADVYLGMFGPSGVVETKNSYEAQLARVDFFRFIDSHPVLGPDPREGLLHTVIRTKTSEQTPLNNPVVDAYFWEINPDSKATYPIIAVEEAWDAVKSGKGVISNVTPKAGNPFAPYTSVKVESILIDNIYLAYYDNKKPQKFLQPIFVFDGKYTTRGTDGGNITIYFPAIIREFTKQETTNPPTQ